MRYGTACILNYLILEVLICIVLYILYSVININKQNFENNCRFCILHSTNKKWYILEISLFITYYCISYITLLTFVHTNKSLLSSFISFYRLISGVYKVVISCWSLILLITYYKQQQIMHYTVILHIQQTILRSN